MRRDRKFSDAAFSELGIFTPTAPPPLQRQTRSDFKVDALHTICRN
jgi:hypothetical protein